MIPMKGETHRQDLPFGQVACDADDRKENENERGEWKITARSVRHNILSDDTRIRYGQFMYELFKEVEEYACRHHLVNDPLRMKISELLTKLEGK